MITSFKCLFVFLAAFASSATSQNSGPGNFPFTMNASISLITAPGLALECRRPTDCRVNEACIMPDFDNGMPLFWPICEHYGTCACLDGTVRIENGTCMPIVLLNLRDVCVGRTNERYSVEGSFCNGTHVVCNLQLYEERFGICILKPQPTPPSPVVVVVPQPVTRLPPIPSLPPVIIVGPGQACDNSGTICDTQRGLACINRICKCGVKPYIYDDSFGYCRPRHYADPCTEHEECNSGYFASTGFECRMGRCRCQSGYQPIDTLYFNETTRSTYSKRICVVVGAHTYSPTGGQCTMYPERYSDRSSMKICHKRSFCRPCHRDMMNGTAYTGICREMACTDDSECGGYGTNNLRCTRKMEMFDPPCERGTCECNYDNGYFMDRFSRCTPRFQLWIGDRCMLHNTKSDPFSHYTYNEVLPYGATCEMKSNYDTEVRCNLPFMEDYDGNCTNNGVWRGYQQECDVNDIRTMCDVHRGLQCLSGKCLCPNLPNYIWDGNTCRQKDYGDQCVASMDCENKVYYSPVTGSATCDNGFCTCGRGFSTFDYTFLVYHEIDDTVRIASRKYCLRTGRFDVVQKGDACHLTPLSQADAETRQPVQVCAPGMVCARCKAERFPDDDAMGTCRLFSPPPPPTPPPPPIIYRNGPGPAPVTQPPWPAWTSQPWSPQPWTPQPWSPQPWAPQPWSPQPWNPPQPWTQPQPWQAWVASTEPPLPTRWIPSNGPIWSSWNPNSWSSWSSPNRNRRQNAPRSHNPSRTSWGGQWIDSNWAAWEQNQRRPEGYQNYPGYPYQRCGGIVNSVNSMLLVAVMVGASTM